MLFGPDVTYVRLHGPRILLIVAASVVLWFLLCLAVLALT